MNIVDRSRRPRPKTGGTEKTRKPLNEDDDIFKDILSDVKQSFSEKPQPQVKKVKVKDEFEKFLEEDNKKLASQIDNDDTFAFKEDTDFTRQPVKFDESEDLDEVLKDLDIGVKGGQSKPTPQQVQQTKEDKAKEDLKKRRAMLFGADSGSTQPQEQTKPKSLLDKAKREELNSSIGEKKKPEERNVQELKEKQKDKSFDIDTSMNLAPSKPSPSDFNQPSSKPVVQQQTFSPEVTSEETRVLKNQIEVLQKRIDQMIKDKEENLNYETDKHRKEIEKINLIHKQEIENLRNNFEYTKNATQRLFDDEKNRMSHIHSQEVSTLTKNQEFKLENMKKYYETQLDSYSGLKKTNVDLTSMSDNVKSNLDELKCIVQEIKFYKSKEENDEESKYSQKQEVLKRFEQSLSDRVKDLERQREIVDNMRRVLEEQMANNNTFFNEERSRLKEKQQQMEEIRIKYEEIITNQKEMILKEQVKVKKLEDELSFKEIELKRRTESHEDNVKRQVAEIESRKNELLKYKESLEEMYSKERRNLDEEHMQLRAEREAMFSEKLSVEELSNEVRREKESLEIEKKNFENERSRQDEEKEYVTKIAISMQQKSLQISERDAEIQKERSELENVRFELDREKSKLKNEMHQIEQKKQDLMIKTKAFENMRFNISKEMNTFEEEKASFFKTNTFNNTNFSGLSKTAQFINDSKFDKNLFKREVSPIKLKNKTIEDSKGRFNLNSFMHELEHKYANPSVSEQLLNENQELIKQKFESSNQDPILRNEMQNSINVHDKQSGSSISLSARNNKNTPITLKSIDVISATDLNSEDKRNKDY